MKKSNLFLALFLSASMATVPFTINAAETCEHEYDYYDDYSPATCTEDAQIIVKCERCGTTEIVPMDDTALGHE